MPNVFLRTFRESNNYPPEGCSYKIPFLLKRRDVTSNPYFFLECTSGGDGGAVKWGGREG